MTTNAIPRRVAIAQIGAFTVACASRGAAQTLTKVRVATSPIDVAAQAYFAVEKGFFRQAGLDVELLNLRPPAVAPAIVGGAADIGAYSTIGLFAAREGGVNFSLIAGAGMYSSRYPGAAIIVAKNGPFHTAADLNGKTFGTESLKNLGTLGILAWGEKNGADIKSYKFLEMTSSEEGAAVGAGRIDAAATLEPFVSRALAEGNVRIIGRQFDAIAPEFCEGGWFCTDAYASANPDVTRVFSAVMDQAAKWANANPQLAGAIMQKYSQAAPTPSAFRTVYPERFDPTKFQVVIDAASRFGILNKPHRATDIIPASLLKA